MTTPQPRPYVDDDYWRVRRFLREVYLRNERRQLSWPLYRWDYWHWHVHANIFQFDLSERILLWEDAAGQLAAALHPEGPGEAYLDWHPHRFAPRLLDGAVLLAESRLAVEKEGRRQLRFWAHEDAVELQAALAARGYERQERAEWQRNRPVSPATDPAGPVPEGYALRALGGPEELPARSWLSWKAFHPDEPDAQYEGWEWYRNVQRAPLYRRDLDLVAVADDGTLAAFCTVWYDDVTRTGAFEPVGTHPEHQRRGLGKAVMAEGLRRLARLGAVEALVSSYGEAAHALYASMSFTSYQRNHPWLKEW